MPSSIPYHPSLVLGSIVDPAALATLLQISACQSAIDNAYDKLKSFIALRQSIDMTIRELANMNIDTADLLTKSGEISQEITKAAVDYSTTRMAQETKIQELRGKTQTIGTAPESPVDFEKTVVSDQPLAAESLSMDVQYFSYNENEQRADSTMASIKDFIEASAELLGDAVAGKLSTAATRQISRQRENHSISGTLIIAASCTHKTAKMLSPLALDADKGIAAWNALFGAGNEAIDTSDPETVRQIAQQKNSGQQSISLLSGASYGSSFIGMVHILRKETTTLLPPSLIDDLQEQLTLGKWLARESGGFGIDPSVSNQIKSLLSSNDISCHINVITMGAIPSLASKEIRMGVKSFSEADAGKIMNQVRNSGAADENKTISSAAASSQSGAEMLAVKNASIQSIMLGLNKIDEEANKVLDMNSLMTAFENFINSVKEGGGGVPINFYLRNISRSQMAALWLNKYYQVKKLSPQDNATADTISGNAG
ncbi:hypothetical protein FAM09_13920 [Niastella caeni]|uniref:Uncharacterized protein n=1 Tax=Niastella caeni TaxID=2569763 RepID=A0A4S8HZI4_9BACT|nr:hypothetical protein [Niastella caeni]THU39594.1 hypothetical protein FAM09_13920 [Niastella caeni]